MVTRVYCSPVEDKLSQASADRVVRLFGSASEHHHSIGNQVWQDFKRLSHTVPITAFDFLSIALSVVAADEFVNRHDHGDDGFGRDFDLTVAIAAPERWQNKLQKLKSLLNFLTGDTWSINLVPGGFTPPQSQARRLLSDKIQVQNRNLVCLFSGGLDSLIGAVNALNDNQLNPLLVSRASTGDNKFQQDLLEKLENPLHFHTNDAPRLALNSDIEKEGSTRARSLLFIALAICCAAAISSANEGANIPVWIPENGVIALNAPLTPRRIGASSTRTTHPHYIGLLNEILADFELNVRLENPYLFETKGEMIDRSPYKHIIAPLIEHSVSCGKYNRNNQQCGVCVPCLIRRSANFAAGIDEPDGLYVHEDIASKVGRDSSTEEDVYAVRYALATLSQRDMASWVLKTGPLSPTAVERHANVAWRGLNELRDLFDYWGIPK